MGPLAIALRKQDYRGNECGLKLKVDDWIELDNKNDNNSDFKTFNVEALHISCHNYKPVHRDILLKRKSL